MLSADAMKNITQKLRGGKGKAEEDEYYDDVQLEWELTSSRAAETPQSAPDSPRIRQRRVRSSSVREEVLHNEKDKHGHRLRKDHRIHGLPRAFDATKITVLNKPRFSSKDLYSLLIKMNWVLFALLFILLYVIVALIWAAIYLIEPDCILNGGTRIYSRLLWFSIQTQTTIGYGYMSPDPVCIWTNIAVALQSISAILLVALVTGIVFRKFAEPSSRIKFSDKILITEVHGQKWLTFRLANKRLTGTYGNKCKLVMISTTTPDMCRIPRQNSHGTDHGVVNRRVDVLHLSRDSAPFLQLGWNLFHQITEDSPLFHLTPEDFQKRNVAFFVTFKAHDPNQGQMIWARAVWTWKEVSWGGRFADMSSLGPDGGRMFDFAQISHIIKDDGEHMDTQITIM